MVAGDGLLWLDECSQHDIDMEIATMCEDCEDCEPATTIRWAKRTLEVSSSLELHIITDCQCSHKTSSSEAGAISSARGWLAAGECHVVTLM